MISLARRPVIQTTAAIVVINYGLSRVSFLRPFPAGRRPGDRIMLSVSASCLNFARAIDLEDGDTRPVFGEPVVVLIPTDPGGVANG